jgi:3-methyl-2-oxobutanoate hydroxymethyltransferase
MAFIPDYPSVVWAERAGIDICAIGDSLGMVSSGFANTLPVTVDMMIEHCEAVARGARNTFRLVAMPYGSSRNPDVAVVNALRFMKEGSVDCVKMQGGRDKFQIIKAIADAGVPVMSHVGMCPHFVHQYGGFKLQGKTADETLKIIDDGIAIQDAGAIGFEIEAVPAPVARAVDAAVDIFTFGIGAGPASCGQLLLAFDRLGVIRPLQAEVHQTLREHFAGRGRRADSVRRRSPEWTISRRRAQLLDEAGRSGEVRESPGKKAVIGRPWALIYFLYINETRAKDPAMEKTERKKRTISEIRASKKTGEKMVYMSVPDYTSAQWAEKAGVDVAVVGDSLAMVAHGHTNTIPATMDMMVMHSLAVRRGAPNTFVLGCMPYQSYNTPDRALVNATRFMQDAGCDAIKPQGGKSQAHILKTLVDAGIPTASHIGLTPHTVAVFGGFKIQGRSADTAMKILEDALAIQDAGCFMLEFEAVPAKIAAVISQQLEIPTIGIGAGVGTDGQILLCYDLLGVFVDFKPKFTKRFANLTEVAVKGISEYVAEVKAGTFPDDDHSYDVDEREYEKFLSLVEKRKHH